MLFDEHVHVYSVKKVDGFNLNVLCFGFFSCFNFVSNLKTIKPKSDGLLKKAATEKCNKEEEEKYQQANGCYFIGRPV